MLNEYINSDKNLTDAQRAALLGALVTRGPRKGLVKKTPPKDASARGAWRALMSVLSVQRMGAWSLVFADDDERNMYDQLDAWSDTWRYVINAKGQRPLEFNLWAHRWAPDAPVFDAMARELCEKR